MTPPSTEPAAQPDGLQEVFDSQRAAFRRDPNPTAGERRAHLEAVGRLLLENTDAIAADIAADFGHRSPHETRLLEIFPSHAAAKHARAHVAHWMRPERKSASIWFWPGRARIVKQPLGVVGVIAPWNYPLYLAVGPLVSALAAGNRVIIKPSELTPRFGELLASLIARHFARDHVAVVNGGVDVARAFTGLPFDHLLFTGSTAVGSVVMGAAAKNLTPVTLELGGKSPALVAPGFPIEKAAERILAGKCLNAGQTCIAPDYVLLPEGSEESFIAAARNAVARFYPEGVASSDYTAIINARHQQRLHDCLGDAVQKGARVVELAGGASESARKFPPTLLLGVDDSMRIMQEEIFGPLLPVKSYRTFDEALGYVSDHPRPLALYLFDHDSARIDRVLAESISGGVTVNDTIFHIAQDELPFGGVGPSGLGQYHGEAGFSTFSKRKGVFLQARLNATGLLLPPFGKTIERLFRLMLR
jgi:acyl-CoA reductase-like NAD-dependent aldehyde dehydrogenase